MREILFRGKRTDNGEWVEGFLVKDTEFYGKPEIHTYIINHKHPSGCYGQDIFLEVDPATVGQYTGLKDKNGKRIFEGDIVRFRTRISTFKPLCVRWYEESCQFLVTTRDGVRSYPMDKSWEYEVIGNIHDNPELLEGGEMKNAIHLPDFA